MDRLPASGSIAASGDIHATNVITGIQHNFTVIFQQPFQPPADLAQLRLDYLTYLRDSYRYLDMKGIRECEGDAVLPGNPTVLSPRSLLPHGPPSRYAAPVRHGRLSATRWHASRALEAGGGLLRRRVAHAVGLTRGNIVRELIPSLAHSCPLPKGEGEARERGT
jgi:hypothetical protein